MLAGVRDHLLQRRQLIVEIAGLLVKEGEPAPDIEVIGRFRRRSLKKIYRSLHTLFIYLVYNGSLLSSSRIGHRKVARRRALHLEPHLALIEIIIRARDPCVGIVRRLLPPFGEQRLDLRIGMLIQELSVTMSEFLATCHLRLRFDVDQGFQNFLERAGILLVTRFIARREDDVSDCLWKLDVSYAFPLGVGLCRRIFVDEVIVAVLSFAGRNLLLRGAVLFLHALDRPFYTFVYAFPLRAGYLRVHDRLRIRPR